MKKSFILIILAAALMLMLTACGAKPAAAEPEPEPTVEPSPEPVIEFANGSFSPYEPEITLVLEEGETSLLDDFTALASADFSGSACIGEIADWAAKHPEISVFYTVELAPGFTASSDETVLDLSELTSEQLSSAAAVLPYLQKLETVYMGSAGDGIGIEEAGLIQAAAPQALVDYSFELYGMTFSLSDEEMILSHIPVNDDGEALTAVLPYMKNCSFVDMDSCGVDNEHMAQLRDSFPDVKIVWRVWFGDVYTCRTDVTRILASSEGHELFDWNSDGLYYCTDVKYLDIGHSGLYDLSFLYNMPELEVLIIACGPWSDASPVASCEKLEYLEVLSTNCNDVSPFAELKKLKHLNIANCWRITDISPLYGMTWLERLWIGAVDPVPQSQKDEIISLLPDTEINIEVYNHKEGGWCKDALGQNVPRYALLREQFGGYTSSAYAYSYNDVLYYKRLDELTEDEILKIMP